MSELRKFIADGHHEIRSDVCKMLHSMQPQEIMAWRHQPLSLDVLQYAVYSNDKRLMVKLMHLFSQEHFVSEENYNGLFGTLNHPVHLACTLGCPQSLAALLDWFGVVEEGKVTIMIKADEFSPDKLCFRYPGENLMGNIIELADHSEECLAIIYQFYSNVAVQNPPEISAPFIERLWHVLDRLCRKTSTPDIHLKVLGVMERNPHSLLPVFQRVCSLVWLSGSGSVDSYACFLTDLCCTPSIRDTLVPPLLTFLTREQLKMLADPLSSAVKSSEMDSPWRTGQYKQLLTLVDRELHGRSLQQECLLAVLGSVGGNCVRTVHIPMAGGLKRLFNVPLWEKWEELTRQSEQINSM